MQPPSQDDVAEFKQSLTEWISVDNCKQLVDDFMRNHGSYARGLRVGKLWRECFYAVRFARATKANFLRIGSDPPDFEFSTSGGCLEVELVVARDIGDMTSSQFVQSAKFIGPKRTTVEVEGDIALNDSWKSLPERIAKQVEAKSKKGYPASFVLAVAAASYWWDSEEKQMEKAIRDA